MIIAIMQARFSSSRLPGKILKPLLKIPMIIHEVNRLKKSKFIDKIVIATSQEASDDIVEMICQQCNVEVFRGSLKDVLDRYYQCANNYQADQIIRVTGDCPLLDWEIVDAVITKHLSEGNDYTSNTLRPTFPDGLDVEIMKFSVLVQAWQQAKLPSEREHVTPYIYKHPELFKLGCLYCFEDLSTMRWTVDEEEDFLFITKVYDSLYPSNKKFTMQDILVLLEKKPDLQKINQKYLRNEGLTKSLVEDQKFFGKGGNSCDRNIK